MKDNFSAQSAAYAQYRPTYPFALYEHILQFVKERNTAWDCGTGNGQSAAELSKYFTTVYATDISGNQLLHAIRKENIIYSKQPAEKTNFGKETFDLIIIAQAIHWFEFGKFFREVNRTGKKDAVIAVTGYGLIQAPGDLQYHLHHFYYNIVGPYWDKERKYIDENYLTIPFPFTELPVAELYIEVEWDIHQFRGYINTWSAVQHFIKANGFNPADDFMNLISLDWPAERKLAFRFPVLQRLGRVH